MPKDKDALTELLARAASGRAARITEAFTNKPEAEKPTLLSKAERLAFMKEALRKRDRARHD
jgi:hypothetical protein